MATKSVSVVPRARMAGYVPCGCRDCFEIAISPDGVTPVLCSECVAAGCHVHGSKTCEICGPRGHECQAQVDRDEFGPRDYSVRA